jgi:hypothetical protein
MFVRFLCNWPPYRDGQCLEVNDRFGSHFVARCMAEVVTAADVRAYARTMETIDRRVARCVADYFAGNVSAKTARAGRRVITQDEWRAELGQDRSSYQKARLAYVAGCINPPGRLPAAITVRS